jgi:hypothetical protein
MPPCDWGNLWFLHLTDFLVLTNLDYRQFTRAKKLCIKNSENVESKMSALRLYFPFTCFSSHMRSTQRLNLITLRHQKSQDRVHACVKLREFPQTYARSQELLNKTSGTFQGKFKGSLWHPHSANPAYYTAGSAQDHLSVYFLSWWVFSLRSPLARLQPLVVIKAHNGVWQRGTFEIVISSS